MNYKKAFSRVSIIGIILFMICSCNFSTVDTEKEVNTLLDNWHLAASNADYDTFFGSMHEDAIYLGTQADERWNKEEFSAFAKPYFDRGKAWSFDPIERNLYYEKEGNLIWFEELLETWMGICRGSGVVIQEGEKYRIIHYNLTVTISNDLVGEFIDIIKKDPINSFLIQE